MEDGSVNYTTHGHLWGKTWRRKIAGRLIRLRPWRDHYVAINMEARTLELFEHSRRGNSSLENCLVINISLDECAVESIPEKKSGRNFAFAVSDGKEHVLFSADTENEKNKWVYTLRNVDEVITSVRLAQIDIRKIFSNGPKPKSFARRPLTDSDSEDEDSEEEAERELNRRAMKCLLEDDDDDRDSMCAQVDVDVDDNASNNVSPLAEKEGGVTVETSEETRRAAAAAVASPADTEDELLCENVLDLPDANRLNGFSGVDQGNYAVAEEAAQLCVSHVTECNGATAS